MRFSVFIIRCLLLIAFLALGALSFAQEATILGTITDPSGAAISDVKITLTNTDTGISSIVTGSSATLQWTNAPSASRNGLPRDGGSA